ncbi:MAG: Alanine--tRNA ligase [Euryarchaeota archaeon ADurb.Bin023]|jgi:alanyl-tRNA synthetase|nr:MAG: Alanine--tRNA ligase [Euryarchaeota archaeon ADurb.Bin023]HNV94689.1 DHHA1 domain-containing protein [Methanofastidiosum sp.]HNZ59898.1 DHHA1 domain-containing protein [Methanofastidiosum sp.]HPU90581.1 DHHA1 domain-containing protein [Methanofastidiosum sp.]HPX23768.1 DHHA1 domain-containing protein [Methanofastidiosum sp.]
MKDKRAHTGEHIFFRSLSTVIPEVSLDKISIKEEKNALYIRCPVEVSWEKLLEAKRLTNDIIAQDRKVIVHNSRKGDVLKDFPNARIKLDRIQTDEVRIIEVENYDYAACSGEHVCSTKEIDFFLLTKVNKTGEDTYRLEFEVAENAKAEAMRLSKIALASMEILQSAPENVERTISNLLRENEKYRRDINEFSEKSFESISPKDVSGINLYFETLKGLDRKLVIKKAGELIKQSKTVLVLFLIDDGIFVICGRSEDIDYDMRPLLNSILTKFGGRGGGRNNFAQGGGSLTDDYEDTIKEIEVEVQKILSSLTC